MLKTLRCVNICIYLKSRFAMLCYKILINIILVSVFTDVFGLLPSNNPYLRQKQNKEDIQSQS